MKLNHVVTMIAAASGLAFGTMACADDQLSAGQKTQVEGVIHDYLLKNPEVLAESIQILQKKQMDQMKNKGQAGALKNASALFNQANDPTGGNPKGKVTVVEFFDYQCPHCVDMDPDIQGLIKSNAEVRVVFKEFPIRGPVSLFAAKAALAASKQGKYMQLHEALMKSAKDLNEDKVLELAKSVGLDVKKLKADMNGDAVNQQIKDTYKLAQELQLFGTPALFVAKTELPKDATASAIDFVPGQVDQKYLQGAVDKASQ